MIKTIDLKVGDLIQVNTGHGYKSLVIEGILYALPDGTKEGNTLMNIVVNHEVFEELTLSKTYQQIDIKIKRGLNVKPVELMLNEIVSRNSSRKISDWRTQNLITNQAQLVMKVFVYGFIAIIILIGFLNILNTMTLRIITRTKEIGLLKASGMASNQTLAMIMLEAVIYGVVACVSGTMVGILMSKALYLRLITSIFGIEWRMNLGSLVMGITITIVITIISVIYPVARTNRISPIEATADIE